MSKNDDNNLSCLKLLYDIIIIITVKTYCKMTIGKFRFKMINIIEVAVTSSVGRDMVIFKAMRGSVSKAHVVLLGVSETLKYGIKQVDEGQITTKTLQLV